MSAAKKNCRNKPEIILESMDCEDRLLVKKVLLNDEQIKKEIKYTKTEFNTAFLKGDPMVISIPKKYLEELKHNYNEGLRKQAEEKTTNGNEVLKNDE